MKIKHNMKYQMRYLPNFYLGYSLRDPSIWAPRLLLNHFRQTCVPRKGTFRFGWGNTYVICTMPWPRHLLSLWPAVLSTWARQVQFLLFLNGAQYSYSPMLLLQAHQASTQNGTGESFTKICTTTNNRAASISLKSKREMQRTVTHSKLDIKNTVGRKCLFLLHDLFDYRMFLHCVWTSEESWLMWDFNSFTATMWSQICNHLFLSFRKKKISTNFCTLSQPRLTPTSWAL